MSLKITTLIENMPGTLEQLFYEHGFSVLVEINNRKILFDTGQSGEFVKNAKVLGIRLPEVDAVVLSHGHYDHTGGVSALLGQLNRKTPFYIGEEFFDPKYKKLEDGSYKYNGNPFEKELLMKEDTLAEIRVVKEDVFRISDDILLLKNFTRVTEYEEVNPKFFVKKEGGYEQDLFADEIALGILTEEGLVLVVGCSHAGIVNILEHVKKHLMVPVAAVVGGTHLVEAGEARLVKTAEALKHHGVKTIAVSHCTGEAGMEFLKQEFGFGFIKNNTGNVLYGKTGKNYCKKRHDVI